MPLSTRQFEVKEAEIDFGSTPVWVKTFSFSEASAATTSRIIATQSYAAPTGKTSDENEMDYLTLAATVNSDGTIDLVAHATPGPVVGNFKINYMVG